MNRVIFVAIEDEFSFHMKPKNIGLVYTGIGKINAAIAVTKYLTANPHVEKVYNYGTAGAADADDSVAGELLAVGWQVDGSVTV